MAEQKLLGIIVAVGLCVVAGIFALMEWNEASDAPEAATVAVSVPESVESPTDPADQYTVSPTPLSGKIVVSKRPVEVLASPSASASALYGFPAGRPFKVLGGDGDYVKIRDVRSGASGWIEEAALAPAPPPAPAATARGSSRPPARAANQTRSRSGSSTAATQQTPQPRERRGLFGGGGIFGGLFGGR